MTTFLLIVHLVITVFMVLAVLLQRSESTGLLGSGGSGSFMSARGSANFMTRLTAILATLFITMSLLLSYLAGTGRSHRSIFDAPDATSAQEIAVDNATPPQHVQPAQSTPDQLPKQDIAQPQ